MDATSLRELQAPLKARYRSDPAAASTPLEARADFRDPVSRAQWTPGRARCEPACTRPPAAMAADACSGDMFSTLWLRARA